MEIMGFKKFISYLDIRESVKEMELNKILDKISKKIGINSREEEFLGKYNSIEDKDMQDYRMLTPQTVFEKIREIIDTNKKIICNLIDRDGKIGMQIISISRNYKDDTFTLELKNKEKIELKDNFLYNIIYDIDRNQYSLEIEDKFFEKLPVKNEN